MRLSVPLALHVSGELGYEAGMANVYCVGMLATYCSEVKNGRFVAIFNFVLKKCQFLG